MSKLLKKLIKEEIEQLLDYSHVNAFEKTSQNADDIKNSYFSTEEWKRFKKIYEIALNIKKTNLAALYFLELLEKLKYLNQNKIEARQLENLSFQIEKLIPYFLRDNNIVIELTPEETYWVKLLYNNVFDDISYSSFSPHIAYNPGNKGIF